MRKLSKTVSVLLCSAVFLSSTTGFNIQALANGTKQLATVLEYTSDIYDEIDPNLDSKTRVSLSANVSAIVHSGPVSDAELKIAKLKTILDRNDISPGVIDGKRNSYLDYAIGIFNEKTGESFSLDNQQSIELLIEQAGAKHSIFIEYEITSEDVAGPFVEKIPNRIQDQTGYKKLGFETIEEALSERFHMDEGFLKRLNPNSDFKKAGTKILVANVGSELQTRVASIKADMNGRRLSAYDKNGKIVAIYPASIGSPQNPSPIGNFKVRNKAGFPKYTLSASNTFEPIDDGQQVVVASGPNNPVGIAWIGLSKKSYGIHGTPWPERVGEAGSHGCIRLTNWDAMELTRLVTTGVEVLIE